MKKTVLKVEGMMCTGCENRIKNVLKEMDGVDEVAADYRNGTVTIQSDDSLDTKAVVEKIKKIGYKVKS